MDEKKTMEYPDYVNWLHSRQYQTVDRMFEHAILGIGGEAGELVDLLKKIVFQDKELEPAEIKEELGDLLFYVTLLCNFLGCDLEDLMRINMAKLNVRYPDGYTDKMSAGRDKEAEAEAMRTAASKSEGGAISSGFIAELKRAATRAREKSPGLRWGQALFTALNEKNYQIAQEVSGSEVDPFYNDERVDSFFAWIVQHLAALDANVCECGRTLSIRKTCNVCDNDE